VLGLDGRLNPVICQPLSAALRISAVISSKLCQRNLKSTSKHITTGTFLADAWPICTKDCTEMPGPELNLRRYDQSWFKRGRSGAVVILWDLCWLLLFRPCPQPFYGWKRFLWRLFGARIGRGVLLRSTVRCNYPWKVTIGDHAWIGEEVWLYALDQIEIGSHAVISQQAYLCTGSHDITDPHFGLRTAPIRIGHGAWIALGATVMPGVTIADGAVIAARSLVTKNMPAWTVCSGTPCVSGKPRVLRTTLNQIGR
jgi:putative colanic acid biosynthesis acetyltransferase WcaF